MFRGVGRNLERFETLRKMDIPPDTELSVSNRTFRPDTLAYKRKRRSQIE